MHRRIEQLRDHFIVCAYGRVGRAAVRELTAAGEPFLVVDPKESLDRAARAGRSAVSHRRRLVSSLCFDGRASTRPAADLRRGLRCDERLHHAHRPAAEPGPVHRARSSEPGSAERLERAGATGSCPRTSSSGRHMVRMARDPQPRRRVRRGVDAGGRSKIEERLVERIRARREDGRGRTGAGPRRPACERRRGGHARADDH